MINSVTFQICALVYMLLIMVIYFSKERIKNIENKIYTYTMVANLVGLIFDIISVITIYYASNSVINLIFSKLYLVSIVLWLTILTIYIFAISLKKNEDVEKKEDIKLISLASIIVFFIFSIIIFILPIKFVNEPGIIYSYGQSTNFVYFITIIYIILWIIRIFARFKFIIKKKCIPIVFYVVLGFVTSIIQKSNPQLLLISFAETFCTFIMYFTIENPDVKMIEQLDAAKKQADKANQAKSDFLSSMSHEIRTPLNAIVGFSQVLDEDQSLSPEAKEEVKDIIMASNSLLEIVNGILDISKIESGKIEIVNQEYSFKEIFDNLVLLTKARLGDKKLDFRYIYDDSIPAVIYGDHTRVKQVILNILTNAVKYTREGFVEFRVSSIIKDDICRLIISVEDSGIGIKEENIDKLFSKFERLDLDKNITIEGTGLGMAITKKLLELMNGKIVVQSVYGKGSKFTVSIDQRIIKMKEETPVEVLDTPTKEEKNIETVDKKVLIVDDNKINLKVASKLLEGYNFNITTADSGNACIELLKQSNSYDIILMDDMMPGMSGVETLHKIKEEYSNFTTPVIALTANAITGVREKYLNEGFNDYLAKPIDKGELNKLIAKYFSK